MVISELTDSVFVSRRGDRYLVFNPETMMVGVLSEPEYLLLSLFLECHRERYEFEIPEISRKLSGQFGLTQADCVSKLRGFLQRMIAKGILPAPDGEGPPKVQLQYIPKPFAPTAIYLHLTDRCNLKCVYCYNSEYRAHAAEARGALSDEEIIDVIDQAHALGVTNYILTGGEALLNRSCIKFGKYVRQEKSCFSELLSNGTIIDKVAPEEVLSAFSMVVISLDSHIREKHDAKRGKGSFDKIVTAVRKLSAIDSNRISLRPVLHKHNIDELKDFVQWAKNQFGITRINSSLYTPNSVEEERRLNLLATPEQYVGMMGCQESCANEGELQVEFEELKVDRGCGAASSILSVGANGEVFSCQAFHKENQIAGNVREQSLKEIGETSPILQAMRNFDPTKIEGCENCSLLWLCGGGCRANANALYGGILKRNELLCPSYVKQYEFLLWKEVDRAGGEVVAIPQPALASSGLPALKS
jgi:radical SAM protein with 4Fe4S-binding SPASM domain